VIAVSGVLIAVNLSAKLSFGHKNPHAELPLRRIVTSLGQALRHVVRVSRQLDNEHFRKQAVLRLKRQHDELQLLAQGKLVFDSTETWRAVYEEVLSACTLKRYLSVALVRTEDYWCGTPGERSIRFNALSVDYGFYVHRILIVDDFLWPPKATIPSKQLYNWMLSQFSKGIQIELVRMSELTSESDLLVDFGIYGDTAVGYQVTDDLGQTVRYEMLFGAPQVQVAEDRWKRLSLYAHPLESI
jgi:hypothetical protein